MEQMLLRGLAALLALLTAVWFVWGTRFAVGLPGALAFALSVLGWLWVAALLALAWRQGQSKGWALAGTALITFPLLTALVLSSLPLSFQVTLVAFVVADGWTWLPLLPLLAGVGLVWRGTAESARAA